MEKYRLKNFTERTKIAKLYESYASYLLDESEVVVQNTNIEKIELIVKTLQTIDIENLPETMVEEDLTDIIFYFNEQLHINTKK